MFWLCGASLVAQMVKRLPAVQETRVRSLGQEDPLEKEMATHSGTLAWKSPWMEEPGRLQSVGSQSQPRLSDFTSSISFSLFSLVGEHRLCVCRLSGCGPRAHVGASWSRDGTCVPCTGRRIRIYCATREVPRLLLLYIKLYIYMCVGLLLGLIV